MNEFNDNLWLPKMPGRRKIEKATTTLGNALKDFLIKEYTEKSIRRLLQDVKLWLPNMEIQASNMQPHPNEEDEPHNGTVQTWGPEEDTVQFELFLQLIYKLQKPTKNEFFDPLLEISLPAEQSFLVVSRLSEKNRTIIADILISDYASDWDLYDFVEKGSNKFSYDTDLCTRHVLGLQVFRSRIIHNESTCGDIDEFYEKDLVETDLSSEPFSNEK